MKIFGWIQSKFNGRQAAIKKTNIHTTTTTTTTNHGPQESCKEEFSDWPNGLLAIGTFGNNNDLSVISPEKHLNAQVNSSLSQLDCTNLQCHLSPEEEVKLQRELKSLLCYYKTEVRELETSLEVSKGTRTYDGNAEYDIDDDDDSPVDNERNGSHLQYSSIIVVKKGSNKAVSLDSPKKAIGKRSLSFLLKKMFACKSGFSVPQSLRDPLPESRMEKMLRSLIHKKVYPQSASTPALAAHKYVDKNHDHPNSGYYQDEIVDKESESGGSGKWVKTDSEYIVLEI